MIKRHQLIIIVCLVVSMLSAVIPSSADEQPIGVWMLQSAQATGVKVYENTAFYPSHAFSLYDGGFTGHTKWQFMKDSGSISCSASWTGFGGTLVPGDMVFSCSLSTQASQTNGYRNSGNQLWVYFDDAKQTDDIKNNGSTDQPIPPRNETLTLRVPGGKVGRTMKVRVVCSNTGGYGEFVYTYVFEETLKTGTIIPGQSIVPPGKGKAPVEPKAGVTGYSITQPTSMKRTTEKPLVLPWPEDPPMEDSGARFSDLAGEVEINTPVGYDAEGKEIYNEERWGIAELNHIIPVGTHIRTSRNSNAILSFADMTTFVLKPETEIVISSPSEKDSQVKLLIGGLWINIRKMLKDGSMDIEMSQAVAGGRGTVFVCEETGTASKVSVLESKVIFTSKADGIWAEVLPGESLTASAAGLGQKEAFDAASEAEAWGFELAEITHSISGNEDVQADAAFALRSGIIFGMDMEQVERAEHITGVTPKRIDETLVYQPLTLEGFDGASLAYHFFDGSLRQITCEFGARHQDAALHIVEYDKLNAALTGGLGAPSKLEENWISPYRVTADLPAALSRGDLSYMTQWQASGAIITHALFADTISKLISHRVIYRDPGFDEEAFRNRDLYALSPAGAPFALRNGVSFGLSRVEALRRETADDVPQAQDSRHLLFDSITVAGLDETMLAYEFTDDKLTAIIYRFGTRHQDASLYLADYQALEQALTLGYSTPLKQEEKWVSPYRVTADHAAALLRGDLSFISAWELPGVTITHELIRDDAGVIQHRIEYR